AAFNHGAFAPSHAVAATAQTPAGPASFADIVDRVKSAVVSVRVKLDDGGDGHVQGQGLPEFPPGSPFDKFFKQFGMPDGNDDGKDDGDGDTPMRRHHHLTMAQGSGFFISADGY